MGNLKPGASYRYEYQNGTMYAFEEGGVGKEVHGWTYDKDHPNFDPRTNDGRPLREHMKEDQLWGEIRRAAKTNSALQEALERVKILYHLSKEDGPK